MSALGLENVIDISGEWLENVWKMTEKRCLENIWKMTGELLEHCRKNEWRITGEWLENDWRMTGKLFWRTLHISLSFIECLDKGWDQDIQPATFFIISLRIIGLHKFSRQLENACKMPKEFPENAWRTPGECLENSWRMLEKCLEIPGWVPGESLENAWIWFTNLVRGSNLLSSFLILWL